ncbi:MAG TPA: hypothetical protein VFP09_10985 [Desertimonas sp.]|nr:hypothetical protein [Desertimonas sp.]
MTRKFLVPIHVNGRVTATGPIEAQDALAVVGQTDLMGQTYVTGLFNTTAEAFLDGPTEFADTVKLAADPTLALQAATKQYVDARTTGVNEVFIGPDDPGAGYELWVDEDATPGAGASLSPSNVTPAPIGTAAPGTSANYSRGDHVHALATPPPWIDLTLQNGWVPFSTALTPQYRIIGDIVEFRGCPRDGTAHQICSLPVGTIPAAGSRDFACVCNGTIIVGVYAHSAGYLTINANFARPMFVYLAPIRYSVLA